MYNNTKGKTNKPQQAGRPGRKYESQQKLQKKHKNNKKAYAQYVMVCVRHKVQRWTENLQIRRYVCV